MNTALINSPDNQTHEVNSDSGLSLKDGSEFRLNNALVIQPTLSVGAADDPFEHEADAMADRVMRMPVSSFIQRKCASCEEEEKIHRMPESSFLQRKCASCEHEEEEQIQRKTAPFIQKQCIGSEGGQASESVTNQINASRGGGSRMSENTLSFMESRFNTDFSGVKIHTDFNAVQMSRELNAQAFTVGSDIYFNSGKYAPDSDSGKHLLAHELTHTVQQGGGVFKKDLNISLKDISIQKLGFESTINMCHRELKSRTFKVSKGGVRVALQIFSPDTNIVDCKNHEFHLTLTRPEGWYRPDQQVSSCTVKTGRNSIIKIGNVPEGDYYFMIWRSFDHPYCCVEGDIQVYDEPVEEKDSDCVKYKELTTMEIVHGALDIAGFIPVLGAIPDGINATIYVVEGDWANAGISVVAMIPVLGDGAKATVMGGKYALKISEKTALKFGEEGLAKVFKEAKAVQTAEEAAKIIKKEATHIEKEAEKKALSTGEKKLEKEAEEKLEKEAKEKLEKEAEEKLEKVAECEAIHAAYKLLGNCKKCKGDDTSVERAAKISCIMSVIAGRTSYLKKNCDYILEGSIKKGSAKAKDGHEIALQQLIKMLNDCSTLPIK